MMTLQEAFDKLPHGDRICELYGECTCGRDEAIAVIKEHLNAAGKQINDVCITCEACGKYHSVFIPCPDLGG